MQLPQLVKFLWAVLGAQIRSNPAIRIVLGYYSRVKLIGEPEKAWRYDPEDDVHPRTSPCSGGREILSPKGMVYSSMQGRSQSAKLCRE